MKLLKHSWALILSLALIYTFNHSLGSIPPLGKLFSPFVGFLQNTKNAGIPTNQELKLVGLQGKVDVLYDDNGVPHIFAENDADLYQAQGYVIARDRLWQMEFYTLVAGGRLTEVVGERALEYDRYNRRLGMYKAAQEIANNLEKDSLSSAILEKYAAGVNAYIDELSDAELPIEYKILDYKPEKWSKYKTILMLMNMRNTLNGGSTDYRVSNVAATYGMDVIRELFTDYPFEESPIIPEGTAWNFTPVPTPAMPASPMAALPKNKELSMRIEEPRPEIGSNNWAVSGEKSATGLPILANDPHLGLSLPSIWYQMQLSSPSVNVYGVALPGSPGIIIGFNKDIAWGVTNVGSDVMDFYQIKFKDETKKEYWHDNQWKPVQETVEVYHLKSGKEIVDTLRSTHHGPIIYEEENEKNFSKNTPAGHAMRWVALETDGSDMLTFHYLNRAKNHDDYRKALTYYTAPAQNFIFASNQNDIAITPNGKLPLKWQGQGKFLLDGTDPSHDWQGWIPVEQNPTVKNPPRGFVSSANQHSVDPTYPYYLGWRFASSERGIRINERLAAMTKATPDSLRMLQNDNFSVAARRILPTLLSILATDKAMSQLPAYQTLANWDKQNEALSVGATIFEKWMEVLMYAIWEDEFSAEKKNMVYPTTDVTYHLLMNKPTAKWFDNQETKGKVETRDDMVKMSFKGTLDSLTKEFGTMDNEKWAWKNVKKTEIAHLVPAFTSFGRYNIPNGGGKWIVNATTTKTGPSWRMVVAVDKGWPKGFGLYPGGQSGNPASKYYDNMIDKWANGELQELLFLKSKEEASPRIVGKLSLQN
ncbi:MAG: penicillin acylase family protein [Spirosomataceae bacterium]